VMDVMKEGKRYREVEGCHQSWTRGQGVGINKSSSNQAGVVKQICGYVDMRIWYVDMCVYILRVSFLFKLRAETILTCKTPVILSCWLLCWLFEGGKR
jgi:hypothetical protein